MKKKIIPLLVLAGVGCAVAAYIRGGKKISTGRWEISDADLYGEKKPTRNA